MKYDSRSSVAGRLIRSKAMRRLRVPGFAFFGFRIRASHPLPMTLMSGVEGSARVGF